MVATLVNSGAGANGIRHRPRERANQDRLRLAFKITSCDLEVQLTGWLMEALFEREPSGFLDFSHGNKVPPYGFAV